MKKILPHFLTSVVTIILCFIGIFNYNKYYSKEENIVYASKYDYVISENETINTSINKVYDSVVFIEALKNGSSIGTGTGFVYKVDDSCGYILTNNHVIQGSTSVKVVFTNQKEVEAKYLGKDSYSDIAVLCVDKTSVISVAQFGDSTLSKLGDTIFTVGSPVGIKYMGTVTKGIISGKNRDVASYGLSVIQYDAAVNPGNSGGPLVNINGEVIGITSMKLVNETIEGIGFAIPIEEVMKNIDVLEKGEEIKRPYLGIETVNFINFFKYGINVPNSITYGVVILGVDDNSTASRNGLKIGDVLLEIDNEKITDTEELKNVLYKHKIGDTIKVKFYRDDDISEKQIVLD